MRTFEQDIIPDVTLPKTNSSHLNFKTFGKGDILLETTIFTCYLSFREGRLLGWSYKFSNFSGKFFGFSARVTYVTNQFAHRTARTNISHSKPTRPFFPIQSYSCCKSSKNKSTLWRLSLLGWIESIQYPCSWCDYDDSLVRVLVKNNQKIRYAPPKIAIKSEDVALEEEIILKGNHHFQVQTCWILEVFSSL